MKGCYKEEVSYGVTDSSLRVNLGAGFTDLFTDEGNRIIATFKGSKDDKLELFYKEDEQSLYCLRKRSAKYVEGYGYCSKCQYFYPVYDHIRLRTSPRKKRNNSKG
jgi:uncharacterized protein YbaR (Trm112 family)